MDERHCFWLRAVNGKCMRCTHISKSSFAHAVFLAARHCTSLPLVFSRSVPLASLASSSLLYSASSPSSSPSRYRQEAGAAASAVTGDARHSTSPSGAREL
eukprot:489241-Pleurochrysis_carterae.AAC.2